MYCRYRICLSYVYVWQLALLLLGVLTCFSNLIYPSIVGWNTIPSGVYNFAISITPIKLGQEMVLLHSIASAPSIPRHVLQEQGTSSCVWLWTWQCTSPLSPCHLIFELEHRFRFRHSQAICYGSTVPFGLISHHIWCSWEWLSQCS